MQDKYKNIRGIYGRRCRISIIVEGLFKKTYYLKLTSMNNHYDMVIQVGSKDFPSVVDYLQELQLQDNLEAILNYFLAERKKFSL